MPLQGRSDYRASTVPVMQAHEQAKYQFTYHKNVTRSMKCIYNPTTPFSGLCSTHQLLRRNQHHDPESPELLFSSTAAPADEELIKSETKPLAIHPDKAAELPPGKAITHPPGCLRKGVRRTAEGCTYNSLALSTLALSREGAGLLLPTQEPGLPKPTQTRGVPRLRHDFCPCTHRERANAERCPATVLLLLGCERACTRLWMCLHTLVDVPAHAGSVHLSTCAGTSVDGCKVV